MFRKPREVRARSRRQTHTHGPDRYNSMNTNEVVASPAVAGSRTKNPVESRRGCIPPGESRGGRTPYKKSHWVLSWLHPVESYPVTSRRGYIPSRGIPWWPDSVQKKVQSRGCRIPYKQNISVPWLPDPVQRIPLKSRGNLIPRDLVPRSKTGPGEGAANFTLIANDDFYTNLVWTRWCLWVFADISARSSRGHTQQKNLYFSFILFPLVLWSFRGYLGEIESRTHTTKKKYILSLYFSPPRLCSIESGSVLPISKS